MNKFQSPLYNTRTTGCTREIIESGIIKAYGFSLAMQCNELIVECTRHYDPNTTPDGNKLEHHRQRETIGCTRQSSVTQTNQWKRIQWYICVHLRWWWARCDISAWRVIDERYTGWRRRINYTYLAKRDKLSKNVIIKLWDHAKKSRIDALQGIMKIMHRRWKGLIQAIYVMKNYQHQRKR